MESDTMNYKELSNIFKKINKWHGKKTKVLSIKTRPFNTVEIFSNILNKVVCNDSNILYVFCSPKEKYAYEKKRELYGYISDTIGIEKIEDKIKCIFIDEINEIDGLYDLVIFDDISLFSKASNQYIKDAIEEIYWNCNRIIVYATEYIFPIGEKIQINHMQSEDPMIEPRLMNTRIRLEQDIPLSLFEYFKWFRENKRVVLIMVPSEDKLNKVYNHYYRTLKELNIRVVRYSKNQDYSFVKEIIHGYSDTLFIVTNSCGQYIRDIPDINIVMLFADDMFYSCKKILYMCAAINVKSDIQSEAIMVSREVSEEMDKAKNMARSFNKNLWERQYLKY